MGVARLSREIGAKRTMMHRLWRYDVFRFAQNDVARFTRNDAMFALMCPQAHIIRRSRHHWRSQHHLPEANIIEKRPRLSTWSFFCIEATKKIFFAFCIKDLNSYVDFVMYFICGTNYILIL